MPDILTLKALIMGVVEGLTEFLPVSSTGHLILAGDLLSFNTEKGKVFEIVIQTGALLAIVWEFRARLFGVVADLPKDARARRFVMNLFVAFLPAAVLGLLFAKPIKAHLFQPIPVALAFIAGAIVILWAEQRAHTVRVASVDAMSLVDAFKVGCVQCLALIPGTSRSGATIIGGLLFGLSRQAATEFSFFLALPTLAAAGAYQLYSARHLLSASDAGWFAAGFVAAFLSALLCVRWLLRYISRHSFAAFAWYRIAFGLVILVTAWFGWISWTEG